MRHQAVRDYYATLPAREWQRLTNHDDGALEYLITCTMLERFLPQGAFLTLAVGRDATRSGWPSVALRWYSPTSGRPC